LVAYGLTQQLLAGAPGGIDDIATYMHLAIVISASEYKAASLRWWNAAWSLARELKLGKEVPVTPPPEPNEEDAPGDLDGDHMSGEYPNSEKSADVYGGCCSLLIGKPSDFCHSRHPREGHARVTPTSSDYQ
jgi:hypothetical protein